MRQNDAFQLPRVIVVPRADRCPATPITDLILAWRNSKVGDILELVASEASIERDVRAWAKKTGNSLLGVSSDKGRRRVTVRITKKGKEKSELSAVKGNVEAPDEVKTTPKSNVRLLTVGGFTLGLRTLDPGWRWSSSMKPLTKTDTCLVRHLGYMLSGRLGFIMDDGSKLEVRPGDFFDVHPGHEAWTIGEVPAVILDLLGAVDGASAFAIQPS